MKTNFNIWNNNFLNIRRANQNSTGRTSNSNSLQSAKDEPKDIVTITPHGKINSIIASLMKQKMNITKSKDSLISRTLEKGGTLDSIKPQLDAYEEQLKNIDTQISSVVAKKIENQAEKMKPQYDNKPKTGDAVQSERLTSILSMSGDLQQARAASAVKAKVDGDSRGLELEIKLDKMYAEFSEGALVAKVENKEAKLADMEQRSFRLASKIAEKLNVISEKAADKQQEAVAETENESIDDNQNSTVRSITENSNGNASDYSADDDKVKE
jgi:hypothetical protein